MAGSIVGCGLPQRSHHSRVTGEPGELASQVKALPGGKTADQHQSGCQQQQRQSLGARRSMQPLSELAEWAPHQRQGDTDARRTLHLHTQARATGRDLQPRDLHRQPEPRPGRLCQGPGRARRRLPVLGPSGLLPGCHLPHPGALQHPRQRAGAADPGRSVAPGHAAHGRLLRRRQDPQPDRRDPCRLSRRHTDRAPRRHRPARTAGQARADPGGGHHRRHRGHPARGRRRQAQAEHPVVAHRRADT